MRPLTRRCPPVGRQQNKPGNTFETETIHSLTSDQVRREERAKDQKGATPALTLNPDCSMTPFKIGQTLRDLYRFAPDAKALLPSTTSYCRLQSIISHSAVDKVDAGKSLSCEVEAAGDEVSANKILTSCNQFLQVVLVSPLIPGNTGSVARTCAASNVSLHLVGPLGFQVDDAKLKRAGLDYWPYVVVKIHSSWADFQDYFKQQEGENRLVAFRKSGTTTYSDFSFKHGDWLVFGCETTGLPSDVLDDCTKRHCGGGALRIPMLDAYVRCLNLSVSVGIALYEASRQLGYPQFQRFLER